MANDINDLVKGLGSTQPAPPSIDPVMISQLTQPNTGPFPPSDDMSVTQSQPQPDLTNFNTATKELNLNQQEQALYQMHLQNLYGQGGVNNPDGSRSSLYQSVQQGPDGRYYNVPTVWNGQRMTEKYVQPGTGQVFDVPNQQALQNIQQMGWNKFPAYETPEQADARYNLMHDYMERDTSQYLKSRKSK